MIAVLEAAVEIEQMKLNAADWQRKADAHAELVKKHTQLACFYQRKASAIREKIAAVEGRGA